MSPRLKYAAIAVGVVTSLALGTAGVSAATRTDQAAPPAADKVIALTFDDGPSAGTAKTLDILVKYNVKATFMLRGDRAAASPAVVKRIAQAGHAIGNHSYDHPDLTSLDARGAAVQMGRTQAAIAAATGSVPTLARAPFGLTNETVDGVLADYGLTNVMWNDQAGDWEDPPVSAIVADTLDRARPGGIILLHEEHANTRAALPKIIEGLRAKGYTFGKIVSTGVYDPDLRSAVKVVR